MASMKLMSKPRILYARHNYMRTLFGDLTEGPILNSQVLFKRVHMHVITNISEV